MNQFKRKKTIALLITASLIMPGVFCTPKSKEAPVEISEKDIESYRKELKDGKPILSVLYQAMKDYSPELDQIGYALTHDNHLPASWLLQTPPYKYWGKKAEDIHPGAGNFMAEDIYKLISGAQHFVDITSLVPFPNGLFKTRIKEALASLIKSGREVKVRILVGSHIDGRGPNQDDYLKELTKDLPAGGKVKLYVGMQRSTQYSFNHAKIVAVDGKSAILGGENLWTDEYLDVYPVHDLNIHIEGPQAYYLHSFTNKTWKSVCDYPWFYFGWHPVSWDSATNKISNECIDSTGLTPQPGQGSLSILGAGRYGALESIFERSANPADYAMLLAFYSAEKTIRLSQQDLLNEGGLSWEAGMNALGFAIARGVQVEIVLSNDDAKAGPFGAGYSTSTLELTARKLREYALKFYTLPNINDVLCKNVTLMPLRFGPSEAWPNGYQFANHAKFFMIDTKLSYIGSENFYPADLIEYGVFISDVGVLASVYVLYWSPLAKYSKNAAISGPHLEPGQCYFKQHPHSSPGDRIE